MMSARDDILGGIRRALSRGRVPAETAAALAERIAAHRRNLIPARAAALDPPARIDLFVAMAEEVQTTVARIASEEGVPAEVARYLAAENLPAELIMAPDPALDRVPWDKTPLLTIRRGRAEAGDAVSLTPVHVNRTLMRLEAEGLIKRDRRAIQIHDWRALATVADFNPGYLHLPSDDVPAAPFRLAS